MWSRFSIRLLGPRLLATVRLSRSTLLHASSFLTQESTSSWVVQTIRSLHCCGVVLVWVRATAHAFVHVLNAALSETIESEDIVHDLRRNQQSECNP